MAVGTSVRIYDLAKELKQDTKRVIEELRREGADVSVPSNSVSREIADKVRNKYFPKTETSPRRVVKVIKKEAVVKAEPIVEETAVPEVAAPETVIQQTAPTPKPTTVSTTRILKMPEPRKPAVAAPAPTVVEAAPKATGQIKELKKRVIVEPTVEPIVDEPLPTIEENVEIAPVEETQIAHRNYPYSGHIQIF